MNAQGRKTSHLYSQRDRSLHCDHEVRGVQWVLEDRFLHPFQLGQQVQVVPTYTEGGNLLMLTSRDTHLISLWTYNDIADFFFF